MNRRNWLRNAAGLLVAAPMVVRAESIMRVRPIAPSGLTILMDYAKAGEDRSAVFVVEANRKALRILRDNLILCHFASQVMHTELQTGIVTYRA